MTEFCNPNLKTKMTKELDMFDKNEKQAAVIAPLLKAWMDEMKTPLYHERIAVVAIDRLNKYQAHIKAGFTEAQALELCKL